MMELLQESQDQQIMNVVKRIQLVVFMERDHLNCISDLVRSYIPRVHTKGLVFIFCFSPLLLRFSCTSLCAVLFEYRYAFETPCRSYELHACMSVCLSGGRSCLSAVSLLEFPRFASFCACLSMFACFLSFFL